MGTTNPDFDQEEVRNVLKSLRSLGGNYQILKNETAFLC